MAWRLRLDIGPHYIDFEGGKRQPEPAAQQQDQQPAMNDQPLVTYVEPLGFRMTGEGAFATEVEC
jgi:hypothetical protein